MEILIKSKANPNYINSYGENPLYYAAKSGNPETIITLLKNSAHINITKKRKKLGFSYIGKNKFIKTPLGAAIAACRNENVKVI